MNKQTIETKHEQLMTTGIVDLVVRSYFFYAVFLLAKNDVFTQLFYKVNKL